MRKRVASVSLIILCFILSNNALLANSNKQLFNSCLQEIVNLNFEAAKQSIALLDEEAESLYLSHYLIFASIIAQKDQLASQNYIGNFSALLSQLQKCKSHPQQYAFISEMYLQKSLVQFQANNMFSALSSFSSAYSYYKKSISTNPGLVCNNKLKAIYNLIFSNLPKKHSNIASWFGISGDQELGFSLLQQYLNQVKTESGLYSEAILITSYSFLKFNVNESQIQSFLTDYKYEVSSPIQKAIFIQCAFKIKQPNLCNVWLNDEGSDFWMLRYLRAKYNLLKQNAAGISQMNNYLGSNTYSDYKADANSLLSWYYNAVSDTLNYWKYQNQILKLNAFTTSEDKKAKYEAELQVYPSETILKGRMLFDIGAFNDALLVLNSDRSNINKVDSLEYHYRIGRCLHYLNRYTEALEQYELAISLAKYNKRYFGPYAALYAAEIEMLLGNSESATTYLNTAKTLNTGEYKSSITTRVGMCLEAL